MQLLRRLNGRFDFLCTYFSYFSCIDLIDLLVSAGKEAKAESGFQQGPLYK